MTPDERRQRIEHARRLFGQTAQVTHQLLDQLDGPTSAALPVLFGLHDLDEFGLHVYATQTIGLLSLARQQLGADGWQQLRERHERGLLHALDRLDEHGPPAPFIP